MMRAMAKLRARARSRALGAKGFEQAAVPEPAARRTGGLLCRPLCLGDVQVRKRLGLRRRLRRMGSLGCVRARARDALGVEHPLQPLQPLQLLQLLQPLQRLHPLHPLHPLQHVQPLGRGATGARSSLGVHGSLRLVEQLLQPLQGVQLLQFVHPLQRLQLVQPLHPLHPLQPVGRGATGVASAPQQHLPHGPALAHTAEQHGRLEASLYSV